MSRLLRGRTVGGDNIAVGSASGQEKFQVAVSPPVERVGGGSNIAVGSPYPVSIIADNQQVGVPTMLREKVGNQ